MPPSNPSKSLRLALAIQAHRFEKHMFTER